MLRPWSIVSPSAHLARMLWADVVRWFVYATRPIVAAVDAVDHALAAVLGAWAEILDGLGIIAGWALLTWGLASLLVWEVWLLSGGVFVLSIVGWKHLRTIFTEGLYPLMRRRKVKRG